MAPYTILSISATGNLHHHNPPQTSPHTTQQAAPAVQSATTVLPPHLITTHDTTITLHSLHSPPRPARKFSAPEPLSSLASTPGLLAGGGSSGRVYLWSLSGALLAAFDAHFGAVHALAFSDDGETLLTGGADAHAHAFRVGDVAALRAPAHAPFVSLVGHTLPVVAVAAGFAGASCRAVTASADRSARVWHVASGVCVGVVLLSSAAVDVVLTRDEAVAYVGTRGGDVVSVRVADVTARGAAAARAPPAMRGDAAVCAVALAPDDAHVAVGYADGALRVFDARTRVGVGLYAKHGTAAVRVVRAVARGSATTTAAADAEARAVCGPLRRARDEEMGATYAPVVEFGGGTRVAEAAWTAIDAAYDAAFAEAAGSAAEEGRGEREEEPVQEVERLRRRNRELEEAGRRLISLVEKEAG